jgi:hypothetical protein
MAAVTCTFQLTNNQLVRVSGADAGTYIPTDNEADVEISSTGYKANQFSKIPNGEGDAYLSQVVDSLLTVIITT